MSERAYRAYDSKGKIQSGVIFGKNDREVIFNLKRKGLVPIELSAPTSTLERKWEEWSLKFQKVPNEDLIVFTRQFYTLFKAGLSLEMLLSTLTRQAENKALKNALKVISDDVQNGLSLAKAFEKHPKIFSKLYVNMIMAGEEAGILEQALGELSEVLEKDDRLHREVASATLYPKIVIGVMALSFYAMVTFIIPKFSAFYANFKATLPLPTRILIAMGYISNHYWYFVFIGLGITTYLLRKYLKTPSGRLKADTLKLKLPVFGVIHQKIAMARFGHLFSALYRSGLPLVRIFEVLAQVIGNEAYALEINQFREGILKGKTISEVMRRAKNFSSIMIESTAIGEQSGSLDQMLSSMAGHFDLEVSHMTKNLTTLIEPILLAMMFGMVTLMALGIFLPMWNMSKAVQGH